MSELLDISTQGVLGENILTLDSETDPRETSHQSWSSTEDKRNMNVLQLVFHQEINESDIDIA